MKHLKLRYISAALVVCKRCKHFLLCGTLHVVIKMSIKMLFLVANITFVQVPSVDNLCFCVLTRQHLIPGS